MRIRAQKQIFERTVYLRKQFSVAKKMFKNNSYTHEEYVLILKGLLNDYKILDEL